METHETPVPIDDPRAAEPIAAVTQPNTTSSEPLPAWLQQDGPRAFTITFSPSGAYDLMLCPCKFMWARVVGIEGTKAKVGANFGTANHLALAHRYTHPELSLSTVEDEVRPMLEAHFDENPQPVEEYRHLGRALQLFHAYNERWKAEDWEVLGVEEKFVRELGTVELSTGGIATSLTVRVRGVRDLTVRWHGSMWVVDHKTRTEWGDLAIAEGRSSFQFQCYAWVTGLSLREDAQDEVGGVIGNYLIARKPLSDPNSSYARSGKAKPRDDFWREPFQFSPQQLAAWRERAMRLAVRLFRTWRDGEWEQYTTGCAHWGQCEYYRLCWEVEPEMQMAAAMGQDYRLREENPFADAWREDAL